MTEAGRTVLDQYLHIIDELSHQKKVGISLQKASGWGITFVSLNLKQLMNSWNPYVE